MSSASDTPDAPLCRWCGGRHGAIVLDLGEQPAADHFPASDDPGPDPVHPLRMWLCSACGLAQLAEDPTTPEEPRGAEPDALVAQARDAVARVQSAGLVPSGGGTVREFGSPHGGSWLDLLGAVGLREVAGEPADVVVDCFGLMHAADQSAGLQERLDALAEDGVLLLQFHTLGAIVADSGWNSLRHGHFAYYSTPVLSGMLAAVGLEVTHGFLFELYGGTVLLAARRAGAPGPRDLQSVRELVARETALGVRDPVVVRGLQAGADASAESLRTYLADARDAGRSVLGYAAASRAVPLLNHARVGPDLLPAVADGSSGKQGRRIPGAGVPIVPADDVEDARPDIVMLFVTDLLGELRARYRDVEARGAQWVLTDPVIRAVPPRADSESS